MFVRWKMRPRRRRRLTRAAQLVRSTRVAGRPRQVVICHLASIRRGGESFFWSQSSFWSSVDAKLARLGLDPATRERVEAACEKVVPRPDVESARTARARLGAIDRRFRKSP